MIPSDAWRGRALCAGMPTEVFFQPEPQGRGDRKNAPDPHAKARAICERCPVIAECLTWAMERGEYGWWGGTTEMQRAALKRKHQRSQQRDDYGRSYAISPLEDARRMAVYERGLSDVEAAGELGIHRATWRSWRIVNNLRAHKPAGSPFPGRPLPDWVNELRDSLYQSGLTDEQIAEGAKCSVSAVKHWRQKRGLPVNNRAKVTA